MEGRDLLAALGTLGVVGMRSTTNHVMEALRVLGIEAARSTIMRETHRTMGAHGMTIDARHTMLLADLMTYKARGAAALYCSEASVHHTVLGCCHRCRTLQVLSSTSLLRACHHATPSCWMSRST